MADGEFVYISYSDRVTESVKAIIILLVDDVMIHRVF